MSSKMRAAALAALSFLLLSGTTLAADDHPFVDGPVYNISKIRTEYGKFDEYMEYLSTTWKKYQEAAKKTGDVLGYKVLLAEPRNPNEPDIYLMITYKNWAAFDNATAKNDAIAKQVEGTLVKANDNAATRGKIRTVLGSETVQELILK